MTIISIVLLVVTIICALAALLFLVRGLQLRAAQASGSYGVAKQESRHEMQVNFLRAGFLLVVTLIMLGIYGLATGQDSSPASSVTATPSISVTATDVEPTEAVSATPERRATPTAEPTAVELTATASPTMTATVDATETPSVPTAVVNSPNGLWLREAPGGAQEVELIAHETELVLLAGRERIDDVDWQQVRTPAGNEGWVAAEFLVFQ